MNQEIEIEFKNLLTREEFIKLKRAFGLGDRDFTLQKNDYFDSPSFDIMQKGSALRIREKNGTYTLTLKQPHEKGLLETHQSLTNDEALQMIETNELVEGDVKEVLQSSGIDTSTIVHLGTLSTERAELEYEKNLLVFDHSHYLDVDDYELEFETADEEEGRALFKKLLEDHGIPFRKTDNKIQRFFHAKKEKGEGSK